MVANQTINFRVDHANLSVALGSPTQNSYDSDGNVSLMWTVSDPIHSSVKCNLSRDNSVNQSNITVLNGTLANWANFTLLTEGLHNWSVSCWDNGTRNGTTEVLLNQNSSLVYNLTVDLTNPTVTINSPTTASPVYRRAGRSFTVNYTYTEQNPSTVTAYLINQSNIIINSTTATITQNGTINSTIDIGINSTALEGKYHINLTITDLASRTNSTVQFNATIVDNINPSVVNASINDSDSILRRTDAVQINVTVTDTNNIASVTVYNNTLDSMSLVSGNLWHVNTTLSSAGSLGCAATDGPCTIFFNATDIAGNENTTTSLSLIIDEVPPSVINSTINDSDRILRKADAIQINVTVIDTNLIAFLNIYNNSVVPMGLISGNLWHVNTTLNALGCTSNDGVCMLFFNATDIAGNQNRTVNLSIMVDDTNPSINFISPAENNNTYFNRNFIAVNVSVTETNEDNITFYLFNSSTMLNSTNLSAGTRGINFTNLNSNMQYWYNVTVRDIVGKINTTETRTITLDTTNPSINFTAPTESNNTYFNRNFIAVNVSASDTNEANITFYLYNSSTQLNATNLSAGSRGINFTNLNSNMVYFYNVTIRDLAGNTNKTEDRKLTLDSTPPTAPTPVSPSDGAISSDTTPYLEWTVSTETNFQNYTIEASSTSDFLTTDHKYTVTNRTVNNYTVLSNDSWATNTVWRWRVTAYDLAGNSNRSGTFTYQTLLQGPIITFATPSGFQNSTNITMTLTTDKISYCRYSSGDMAFVNMTNNFNVTGAYSHSTNINATEGLNIYYIRCTEELPNTNPMSSSELITFTVDTQRPVITSITPGNSSRTNSRAVSFSLRDTTSGINQSTISVLWNGSVSLNFSNSTSCMDNGLNGYDCSYTESNITEGLNNLTFDAKDKAGNSINLTAVLFTYDSIAPNLTNLKPDSTQNSRTFLVQVNSSEESTCRYAFSNVTYDDMGNSMTEVNDSEDLFQANAVVVGDGSYTAYFACRDVVGNTGNASTTFTVSVSVTGAPTISSSGPTGYINSFSNLTATTTTNAYCKYDTVDRAFANMSYNFSNSVQTSHSVNAPSLYKEGLNVFYIRCADDGAGTNAAASSVIIDFILDTVNPVITSIVPVNNSYTNSNLTSFSARDTTSKINQTRISVLWNGSVSLDFSNSTHCSDNGLGGYDCSYQERNLTQGSNNITIIAYDLAGNIRTEATIFTYDKVLPAISITAPTGVQNTKSLTLAATLSESGYCRYSTSNVSYGSMGSQMTNLSSTSFVAGIYANESANTYYVACLDLAGNENSTSTTFYVNTTAPVILRSAPDGYINSLQNLSLDTDESSFCRYDTADRNFSSMSYSFPSQTINHSVNASALYIEGLNIFYIRCADNSAGVNAMSSSVMIDFILDTQAPMITINSPSNNSILSSSLLQVNFDVTDAVSGINLSSIITTLNSTGLGLSCSSITNGFRCSNTTNQSDGSYSITVNATDNANNSATSTIYLRIDTAGPAAPVLSDPGNFTNIALVTWNWGSVTDVSGIKHYEIQIDDENSFGAPLIDAATTTELNYTSQFVVSKTYFARVRAVDNASNSGSWSNIENITVSTGIDSAAQPDALPEWTRIGNITINWTLNPGSDVNGIWKYSLFRSTDGISYSAIFNTTSSSITNYTDVNLSDGKYYYKLRTFDNANNSADSIPVWTTIDTVPPTSPILISPANRTITNSLIQTFTWGSVPDVMNYSININGTIYTVNQTAWTISLNSGRYNWSVLATDKAGNNGSFSDTWTLILDNLAPNTPVLSDPGEYDSDGMVTWGWSSVTDNGDAGIKHYEIQIDDEVSFGEPLIDTRTTTATNYTSQFVVSNKRYFARVRAIDNASNSGSWSNIENITVTTGIDTAAQPNALPEYTNVSYVVLNWTNSPGSDSDGIQKYGVLRSTDGAVYSSIINTTNTTYTDTNVTEGTKYYYKVRTFDNANNSADSAAVWTTISATAPSSLSISINGGDTYTKSVAVTLTSGATNAYQCRYSNDGSSFSSWGDYATVASWTLSTGDGTKTVYYMCKNRGGMTSSAVSDTITLDTTVPALTITSPTAGSEVSGVVTITFTGAENSPQISIDGGTWTSTATSSTHSWDTTSVQDGTHTIQVRSTDASGNLGYSNQVLVTVSNLAPVGVLKSDKSYVKNNDTINFTIQFYEYSGTYYTITISTGVIDSNGIAISLTDTDNDGLYTGKYTISTGNTISDGIKTITATVVPKFGSSFVKTTSVVLDNTKPSVPVIISSFAENTAVNNNNPGFNFTSSDSSGIKNYSHVLTTTDEIPDNVSEGNSGNVSYKNLENGIYHFRIRAEDNAGNWGDVGNYTVNVDVLRYNMTKGYNLISLPVDTRNMTASEFLDKIGSDAVQITRWNYELQKYVSHVKGFTQNNFIIGNPDAYWVMVSKNLTFEFKGYNYTVANITIVKGWNMISWMNTTPSNAQSVLDSIGSSAKTIAYYNTTIQDFITYATGMGGVKNFTVNNELGYWIYVSENVSLKWMPAGFLQQQPDKPSNLIMGSVYKNESPVENATVILTHKPHELSAITEGGIYTFSVNYPANELIEITAAKGGFSGSVEGRTNGEAYQSLSPISLNYPFYESGENFNSGIQKRISGMNLTMDIIAGEDVSNATLTIMAFPKPEYLPVKGVKKFRIATDKAFNISTMMLTANYTTNETAGVNESTIALYRLENQWEKLNNSNLNTEKNYISSQISGFGYYALGGNAIISGFNLTLHKDWNLISLPFEA